MSANSNDLVITPLVTIFHCSQGFCGTTSQLSQQDYMHETNDYDGLLPGFHLHCTDENADDNPVLIPPQILHLLKTLTILKKYLSLQLSSPHL